MAGLAALAAGVTETPGYVLLEMGLILSLVSWPIDDEKRIFETQTLVGLRPQRGRAHGVHTRLGCSSDNLAPYDTKTLSNSCCVSRENSFSFIPQIMVNEVAKDSCAPHTDSQTAES